MKASAVLTSKGQLTLPKAVRKHLGLETGDRVEFVVTGRDVMVIARNRPIASLFGRLSGYARAGTSLADYDAALASGIADHVEPRPADESLDAV